MSQDKKVNDNETIEFTLPKYQIVHPETKKILLVVEPSAGKTFQVKFTQNISPEEMIVAIKDMTEMFYLQTMNFQRALYKLGMSKEEAGEICFPGVPKIESDSCKVDDLKALKSVN